MTNSLGFIELNRITSTQRAKAPVQSLTSKTVEAKGNPHQTKIETERLTEKLKDDTLEAWQRRKIELKLKLKGEGWNPAKKLATSSMEKIRLLNAEFPEVWTMKRLSGQFKVSQEAIRRILKSRFQPSESHTQKREKKRSMQIKEYKHSRLDRVQKTK
ncbi:Required for respiratory growth protein 9 mitochondrial [Coemansia sp. RSA 2049]|nr:Required for respiratory growth protein 9 mitochondrial [Coemansia sp. RSA 2049]